MSSPESKKTSFSTEKNRKTEAIIQIVIVDAKAIMKQLNISLTEWEFDAPLVFSGTRSALSEEEELNKIEDIANGETFVAYDPGTRKLLVQIDCRIEDVTPKAYISFSDGHLQEISFVKREHILWAEIDNLNDGNYKLILEK